MKTREETATEFINPAGSASRWNLDAMLDEIMRLRARDAHALTLAEFVVRHYPSLDEGIEWGDGQNFDESNLPILVAARALTGKEIAR